jgi:hypothetical protein
VPKGKGPGRTSKYTPECVEQICSAIARTGSDRAGWEAGSIGKDAFYTWLKKYPEFSELILSAKSEYRATCPEALIRQANKAFSDYLFGRMEKVITTRRTGSTPMGAYEEEKVQRVPVGIPRWAIERVLGGPIDEFEAIKVLVKAGYFPKELLEVTESEFSQLRSRIKGIFAGILPDLRSGKSAGLTDETADAIRREILGVEPQSSSALPEALDRGQESGQGLREESADRPIVG